MKFLCLLTVKIILRYHGRWILTKKWKKNIFPVQIEKTGINILQKNGKKAFLLFKIEVREKLFLNRINPCWCIDKFLSSLINAQVAIGG